MPQPETADGIEQQAPFYASTGSGGEAVEHFIRPRIVLPDVKFDMHMMPRFLDPLPKCGEECAAVDQQPCLLRARDGVFMQVQKQLRMLSLLWGEMLETRFGVGTNASLSSPSRSVHLAGRSQVLPDEPICSEDEVEDRAGVSKQNDGPDPGESRSRRFVAQ